MQIAGRECELRIDLCKPAMRDWAINRAVFSFQQSAFSDQQLAISN
jgi:hypothetical protein